MKKFVFLFILLLTAGHVFSQVKNPVKWTFSSRKISSTKYEIRMEATVAPSWHIYSQTTPPGGPYATAISFTKNPLISFDGDVKEVGQLEQKHEALFGVDVKQFSNNVVFVQTVTVKAKAKTAIAGTVEYMTCNNKECLPPTTQKFSIVLP